uniref:Uncharacterized protein n=1 Tax=Panagrolaimus superbus TaxID=310955 RepID=A0A914YRC2_9BILA
MQRPHCKKNNPTAHDLPDRRNKSKSVYQMGLLPRTVPVIRKSRNRSKGSQPPSGDEGSSLSHSPSTTTKVRQPPTNDEEFNALPAATFSPSILTSSVSKTGAKRGRKSNPFALEPASSSKGQRLALSKISSPLPKESIKLSPPSSKESATSSTPLESKESTPAAPVSAAASAEEETVAIKEEPSIPLADNILPTPTQEEYFIAPLPPKPVPFDFNNPTANELPERRNKSKSVFEIAPQLAKKDTVRRPRKQSLKKISASENETFGGIIYDTVKGASADLKNIEGEKVGNINDGVTNAASASSSNIAVADKKKKRKRKRPLRLTMKKKKVSRASMAVELFEDEVEDGSKDFENVEFDDEISEEEVIAECELEDYGANSSQYLSNLHPNVQASLKPYEQDDGSYFTRFVL